MSYCCSEDLSCIFRSRNKNAINGKKPTNVKCNCRNKSFCALGGNCEQNDVIYKCIASTSVNPDKVYLEMTEGEFKKQYYNHNKLFRHCSNANETAVSNYVWEIKDKYHEMPALKLCVVKSVPGFFEEVFTVYP